MYAFLLALGAVVTAAGLALLASGVSVQQHTFDAANLTPGVVAVIGGCILIGLAFVVRALLHVERALMQRPMPRTSRPGETATSAASAERPSETARIPFPPKPKSVPHPASISAAATENAVLERLRERMPAMERLDNAPLVEESDVSLLPKSPARPEEESAEIGYASAASRANGAAHPRTAPRIGLSGRSLRRPQPPKRTIFDSLWPKAPAPVTETRGAAGAAAVSSAAAPASPPAEDSRYALQPAPPSSPLPPGVSILKSGVVEGMAYTLYSDGSIEAQLPQGTLRFGSITELRNHIEQHS